MNAKTLRIPPAAPPSPAANTPTPRIPQPASAGRALTQGRGARRRWWRRRRDAVLGMFPEK
jgi:hypothetical protein